MSRLVHVHGIATVGEAAAFVAAGADVIGIQVGAPTGRRAVSADEAVRIAAAAAGARLCVEAEGPPDVALLRRLGASVVSVPWGPTIDRAWREAVTRAGIGWVLTRVPASEDDDPSWVASRLSEAGPPEPAWAEIELAPDLEDGWALLREPNPDELDAADLEALARSRPIVFAGPIRGDNLEELRRALPSAHGFAFTLGDALGRAPGSHPVPVAEALALVRAVRAGG